jgi:hypothetical protein
MLIRPLRRVLRPGVLRQPSTPGSTNYGAGSRAVVIPVYNTLTVQIWGAGGGGAGNTDAESNVIGPNNFFGGTGGGSSFAYPGGTLISNGGTGGGNAYFSVPVSPGSNGSPGGASGGSTNTTGGGNAGGAPAVYSPSYPPGRGGNGGYVIRTWNFGDPGAPGGLWLHAELGQRRRARPR